MYTYKIYLFLMYKKKYLGKILIMKDMKEKNIQHMLKRSCWQLNKLKKAQRNTYRLCFGKVKLQVECCLN